MTTIRSAAQEYWDKHGIVPKPAPPDDAAWLQTYQRELRDAEAQAAINRMIERNDGKSRKG